MIPVLLPVTALLAGCVEPEARLLPNAPLADRIAADCDRRGGTTARDRVGGGMKSVRCHLPNGRVESWGVMLD
ncbi:hypothetical protein ACEYYB_13680 [Paracoccus sp. p4-l81]|uniref:hypothetical protein n=1 Tax=unclassified Paracoccus (in: a-proteobacteria) TaxID=2688777 RepID=UPI0035B7BF77